MENVNRCIIDTLWRARGSLLDGDARVESLSHLAGFGARCRGSAHGVGSSKRPPV